MTTDCIMICGSCPFTDSVVNLTSPVQVKCTKTGAFHWPTDECELNERGDNMEFYIKASDIGKIINPGKNDIVRRYTDLEIANTVITRCYECRWYDVDERMCHFHKRTMKENGYCSCGKEIDG